MQQLRIINVRLTPVSKFVDTILFARDIWGAAGDAELTYVCNVGEIFALQRRVRWDVN
jgi:hypothetical protein